MLSNALQGRLPGNYTWLILGLVGILYTAAGCRKTNDFDNQPQVRLDITVFDDTLAMMLSHSHELETTGWDPYDDVYQWDKLLMEGIAYDDRLRSWKVSIHAYLLKDSLGKVLGPEWCMVVLAQADSLENYVFLKPNSTRFVADYFSGLPVETRKEWRVTQGVGSWSGLLNTEEPIDFAISTDPVAMRAVLRLKGRLVK